MPNGKIYSLASRSLCPNSTDMFVALLQSGWTVWSTGSNSFDSGVSFAVFVVSVCCWSMMCVSLFECGALYFAGEGMFSLRL